jgi:trans-aconitate methyltransferase
MSDGIAEAHLVYARHATAYDRLRSRSLQARAYLDAVQAAVPASGEILDLGCGMGEPIARHLIELGHRVTGVDAAPAMIARRRERFPHQRWLEADLRGFTLDRHYDAAIA